MKFLPLPSDCQEAQADVIDRPVAFGVAERRTEQANNLIEGASALVLRKCLGEWPCKRLDPASHISWKDNGTRKKFYGFHVKSRGLQL